MKKIIIFLLLFLNFSVIFAEKKISSYCSSYFDNETFDIECTEVKGGKFSYYIYCYSKDVTHKEIGFELDSKNIPVFIEQLNIIKSKFIEWKEVAIKNNVTDFDKNFDVSFKPVDVFFRYGSHYHFTGTRFVPYFKVTSKGECLVVFNVGELTARDNRYMKVKGFMLVFSTESEIDEFIEAIDMSLAVESQKEKDDKSLLFE